MLVYCKAVWFSTCHNRTAIMKCTQFYNDDFIKYLAERKLHFPAIVKNHSSCSTTRHWQLYFIIMKIWSHFKWFESVCWWPTIVYWCIMQEHRSHGSNMRIIRMDAAVARAECNVVGDFKFIPRLVVLCDFWQISRKKNHSHIRIDVIGKVKYIQWTVYY